VAAGCANGLELGRRAWCPPRGSRAVDTVLLPMSLYTYICGRGETQELPAAKYRRIRCPSVRRDEQQLFCIRNGQWNSSNSFHRTFTHSQRQWLPERAHIGTVRGEIPRRTSGCDFCVLHWMRAMQQPSRGRSCTTDTSM
jgi:hypothetical protein